jgi:hypothetical protein
MSTSNINLKVPFNEKDQAKALGARWNAELKLWYVPQGVNSTPFEKWFVNARVPTKGAVETTALHEQTYADDLDAINAKFRDAYEEREVEEF